jgi:hypothetical protein
MTEDACFLRESVVDVDAAVVGISSTRWTSIPPGEATPERAAQIMRANRFDTLPIESPGDVREYFQTQVWNDYSSVVRRTVNHRDVISFTTPLRNVIQKFALESRNFYFLTSERRVVGLISIANLNCRQVKVYLFSLLSELEIQLGNLVSRHCSESELLEMTFGTNKHPKYADVKKRYNSDKDRGVDVPFVEYLYLSDLFDVIRKRGLFDQLGYQSGAECDDVFRPLVPLRNTVAHATRSLITDPESCKTLWQRIDQVEGVLFHLR